MDRSALSRRACDCAACTDCCRRQPGPLAPGDFEAIAAFLGEAPAVARLHFWASRGAKVMDVTGQVSWVGTITPRYENGRCVFLDRRDRCSIHAVAPFGCAFFDMHMSAAEAWPRATALVTAQRDSEEYQALRAELPTATHYQPRSW